MRRTKSKNKQAQLTGASIQALTGELTRRAVLSSRLSSQTFGGDRKIYDALGYPATLTFDDYYARYQRQDIAKAVIDKPIKYTWQGSLELLESDDANETPLEKEWKLLNNSLKLKSIFTRVDKLTGIGNYGVLLLGLDDVTTNLELERGVLKGKRQLLYVKPLSQSTATIHSYNTDTKSERYGLPELYKIDLESVESNNSVLVHHSRIIHIIDSPLESEVEGTPRLESVFNRLLDIEKIVGGDAEMFWKGARPGYSGNLKEGYRMRASMFEDLDEQLEEYEHGLRRFLINEGLDLNSLAQQIADPKNHLEIQLQMISTETNIPKRMLTGSERGELSSTSDRDEWLTIVSSRRTEYAEPQIIRPFVDKLIEYGILPPPNGDEVEDYKVNWSDLFSLNEKDKAEIGKTRASALKEYTSNPAAEMVIPPDAFMEFFLGLDSDQIELINEMVSNMTEEERMGITPEEEESMQRTNPPGEEEEEEEQSMQRTR